MLAITGAGGKRSCRLTQRPWEDREPGQKQKRNPGPQGREAQSGTSDLARGLM